jgi:ATP-dependent Clp protease adaptor protein ClpS
MIKISEKSQLTLTIEDVVNQQDGDYVLEKQTAKLKMPSLYQVVLLNDDYTPMDFVVMLLTSYFHLNEESATQVMLQVHTEGSGVCGVYPKDIAETKADEVNECAVEYDHPLKCIVRAVE